MYTVQCSTEVYSVYLTQRFTIEKCTCHCPLVDKLCTLALVYCSLLIPNGNTDSFEIIY